MDQRNAGRVRGAVLIQPVALPPDNAALCEAMWREWGQRLQTEARLTAEELEAFGIAIWRERGDPR
jgi:hypothetical protein